MDNIEADINADLQRTKKAIVGIGCSFVEGGELGTIYEKNNQNFLHVLCKKYLKSTYTPINFGKEGAGNFASIAKLFLYDIHWQDLDEIIIIFLPTGMQRFDVLRDDSWGIGKDFNTLWPNAPKNPGHGINWHFFNKWYGLTTHSVKFEILNAILNFQFLTSWATNHNAELLIFPAFEETYNKEYFQDILSQDFYRTENHELRLRNPKGFVFDYSFQIDLVPWDKFITIDESRTFFDLVFRNDKHYSSKLSMFDVITYQQMANNDWIMPKGHPSQRGHKLFAKRLFQNFF
jgi:hypothetical protein